MIYHDTPYSISSKVLEKYIQNITREDLIEYYNNIFNPENMVISINGNIDKDRAIKELNNIFKAKETPATFDYAQYTSQITPITSPRQTIQKNDLNRNSLDFTRLAG